MSMQLSKTGAMFIQDLEEPDGVKLTPYKCQAGVLTIAIGHTAEAGPPEVVEGMHITLDEAYAIFYRDIAPIQNAINQAVLSAEIKLEQHEFDALVSFALNNGVEALLGSTAWKWLVEKKPRTSVACALCKWTKLVDPDTGEKIDHPDLADRRIREAILFVEGDYMETEVVN
jgi:lysozyme